MKLLNPANASLLAIASMCKLPQSAHKAATVLCSSDVCLSERLRAAADCCKHPEMIKSKISWSVSTAYGQAIWTITLYKNCFELVADAPQHGIVTVYGDDQKGITIKADDDLSAVEKSYNEKCAWMATELDNSDPIPPFTTSKTGNTIFSSGMSMETASST